MSTTLGRAYVVSAEHASAAVPPDLGRLGVDPAVFESHVAWDPGARELAVALAQSFDAPLFLGEWTRLVADLNRSPENPAAVPAIAFGVPVPANQGLSDADRSRRMATYHAPYWSAVLGAIEAGLAGGRTVVHLAAHSFTPVYEGRRREVEVGILLDPDHPIEGPIGRALVQRIAETGLVTRLNEPYDGRGDALTTACRNRFPPDRYASVEYEISHALLGDLDRVIDRVVEATRHVLEVSPGTNAPPREADPRV